jgi:DNA replication protein DnaC
MENLKKEVSPATNPLVPLTTLKDRLLKAQEDQRDSWYDKCGLSSLFISKDFANFDRKLQPKAYDAISQYHGNSIVLLSPGIFGIGKTHLVGALCNRMLEETEPAKIYPNSDIIRRRPCPVKFIGELKLLSRIRQSFNHEDNSETEEDIYEELSSEDLLIIDDVGKTKPHDNSFLQSVYFRIIDDRYNNQLPIILTTNLSLNELEEHIGGASSDRLREMCGKSGFIVMAGKSYRKGIENEKTK